LDMSGRGPFRRTPAIRPGQACRYDEHTHLHCVQLRKPYIVAPGTVNAPRSSACRMERFANATQLGTKPSFPDDAVIDHHAAFEQDPGVFVLQDFPMT